MTKPQTGKIAMVFGGSRGIGAAIVRRLSEDGVSVAFTYAASDDAAHALSASIIADGGQALPIKADSASADAIQSAVAQTAARFGAIDILVNNAGILTRGDVGGYDLSDFERMFAINVRAVFVAVQAVLPHMGAGGRIITTGSVSADRTGVAGSSVYSMTKGAVAALTRSLAWDLGPRGITVNTIQPGPTETDIVADEPTRAMLRPLIALGRMGKDTEIANLVAWLAGPESSFVTGSALTIDGGFLA